jgi:hypothetical protein
MSTSVADIFGLGPVPLGRARTATLDEPEKNLDPVVDLAAGCSSSLMTGPDGPGRDQRETTP